MATSSKTKKADKTPAKQADKQSVKKYFRGVRSEFKKVVWPTKDQVAKYSVVVIVVSILVALGIYVLDYIFRGILGLIIG